MDLSIALTDCTTAEALPALKAITALLRECSAKTEFLMLVDAPDTEAPADVDGCPVRQITVADPGCGAQLRAAREACKGRWLITLEHPTERDASLVYAFWHRRYEGELLIASRYAAGGSHSMPRLRTFFSRTLNALYRFVLSLPVRDLSSGRRMYRRSLLRRVELEGQDYDVMMEVLLRFMSKGGRIAEVPWHFESKYHRQNPGTAGRLIRSSLSTLKRMHDLRNSVDFPDYDYRAHDSRIWFQRYWQRKRFDIIRGYSPDIGKVLDIGCGSSRIITTRPEMVGLDINLSRLRYLRGTVPRLLQATAGALPFADQHFDTVITSQVIEHTPELNSIEEAARVLRVDGTLIVGTPDYGRIWWPLTERVYGFVKRGGYADDHITHYTFDAMANEIARCGCEVLSHKYIAGGELIMRARKQRHVAPGEGVPLPELASS